MLTRANQVVIPRARRTRERRARRPDSSSKWRDMLIRKGTGTMFQILLLLLGLGGLGLAYRALTSTSAFQVKTLRIEGNVRVPPEEIQALVREATARGTLRTDLGELRDRLRQHPLIKDVEITRVLPDELRLRIRERVPVALVAQSHRTPVCVDEEGVILGDFHLLGSQTLPLLVGWNEEDSDVARVENRHRVALYRQLQKELSEPEPSYWDRVDQVNIRDVQDVTVNLTESPMTWIHLGDRDFRRRFELSLQILNAVKKQDAMELRRLGVAPTAELLQEDVTISYIDVSQPARVVVRLPEPRRATSSPERSRGAAEGPSRDREIARGSRAESPQATPRAQRHANPRRAR